MISKIELASGLLVELLFFVVLVHPFRLVDLEGAGRGEAQLHDERETACLIGDARVVAADESFQGLGNVVEFQEAAGRAIRLGLEELHGSGGRHVLLHEHFSHRLVAD